MSHKKDIIPAGDQDFSTFEQTVVANSTTNQLAWGIPNAALTALTDAQAIWTPAWNAAKNKNTRSREDVLDKDAARNTYEPVLRNFLQTQIVRNDLITDGQRAAMGIQPYDTHHTPIPKPVAIPVVDIQSGVGRSIVIHFKRESDIPGQFKRGKPEGVASIQVKYVINPAQPPATPNECNEFVAPTRSPLRIEHDPDDSGKMVYFFCRYANPRNEGGPWSPVYSFMIP